MAAERISGTQARLQVDLRSRTQGAQRRFGQGLARNVRVEARPLLAGHCQAGALHAHAVADGNAMQVERGGVDPQFQVAIRLGQGDDAAGGQDDSGEHTKLSWVR